MSDGRANALPCPPLATPMSCTACVESMIHKISISTCVFGKDGQYGSHDDKGAKPDHNWYSRITHHPSSLSQILV